MANECLREKDAITERFHQKLVQNHSCTRNKSRKVHMPRKCPSRLPRTDPWAAGKLVKDRRTEERFVVGRSAAAEDCRVVGQEAVVCLAPLEVPCLAPPMAADPAALAVPCPPAPATGSKVGFPAFDCSLAHYIFELRRAY